MITISELSPSLPIRISRAQLLSLLADLGPVLCASLSQIYATDGMNLVPLTGLPRCIELYHDPLIRLWKRLNLMAANEKERYRTRLDAFEAAMCGLALRAAAKRERTNPTSGNSQATTRRSELMRITENHRKRAARKFKLTVGTKAADELAIKLHEFQMLLRPQPIPQWLKFRDGLLKHRKAWINQLVGYATERLLEAGPPIPPAKETRRLVRLFVRYVRRGRYQFSMRKLTEDKESAMPVLAAFILQRWNGDETNPSVQDLAQLLHPPRAAPA